MSASDRFNKTAFSRWLNRKPGRIFRLGAGVFFVIVGTIFHSSAWGIAALIWSVFPLSAGIFDVCYISAVLGGPFKGVKVRKCQSELLSQKF